MSNLGLWIFQMPNMIAFIWTGDEDQLSRSSCPGNFEQFKSPSLSKRGKCFIQKISEIDWIVLTTWNRNTEDIGRRSSSIAGDNLIHINKFICVQNIHQNRMYLFIMIIYKPWNVRRLSPSPAAASLCLVNRVGTSSAFLSPRQQKLCVYEEACEAAMERRVAVNRLPRWVYGPNNLKTSARSN